MWKRGESFILGAPQGGSASSSTSRYSSDDMNTEEREDNVPTWCPDQQIYIGGVVPDNAQVQQLIQENEGRLRLFGYGSLCWNPGTGALAKPGVLTTPGRARGYKRCWAQKSADHRGTASFPGIVCTLLRDDEVQEITKRHHDAPTMTEGLLYTVPQHLVEECLEELDFREKGGYARDVIDVVQDDTGETVQAVLYRGTPDNPAFWNRALLDLPFAAAIMAVSIGPSGGNDAYLYNLDEFMEQAASSSTAAADALRDHTGDTDTGDLADMVKVIQDKYQLHFLFGSGSNQHNQLMLESQNADILLVNGEDAWKLTEIVLCTDRNDGEQIPKALLAGGGHSGILMESGLLYLWGWNNHGQLGSSGATDASHDALSCVSRLGGLDVAEAALGFSHTLVIEKGTGYLYAFGDNGRGQVDGTTTCAFMNEPVTPEFVQGASFCHVSAGLFHSAAITASGDEVVTFGCGRFGQCLSEGDINKDVWTGRWRPNDGSRLVRVACGRRHTVVLDEHGRVWTFGENKHGQLGRSIDDRKFDGVPRLVEGALGEKGSGCFDIDSGWSHTIARVVPSLGQSASIYGWGRNDKGQLGTGSAEAVALPRVLFEDVDGIQSMSCGSEYTVLVNGAGTILGCGWNEHGNLSVGDNMDSLDLKSIKGARIVAPPSFEATDKVLIASGGAHFLAIKA